MRVNLGMPRSRHAHPSITFVNSNVTKEFVHGPFSSPYILESAFQKAMAFCNKRDQRSYVQVLSSQCDSPLHKADKWSGGAENNYLVNSTSFVGGQNSVNTRTSMMVANVISKHYIKTVNRFVYVILNRIRLVLHVEL